MTAGTSYALQQLQPERINAFVIVGDSAEGAWVWLAKDWQCVF